MADQHQAHPGAPLFAMPDTRLRGGELVSVVTPMFNEAGGAVPFVREIASALHGRDHEIICVNDGSSDETEAALCAVMGEFPQLRVLRHDTNAGQSRAVRTGVLAACGETIVTLDGDGQNNPADIPLLLAALNEENAPPHRMMAAGERQGRQDTAAKKIASRWANGIRARLLKDGARDTGCGLKAFRRSAYLRLPYFDHCHRYLPALMRREGFEVVFVPVSHRARAHGASKYTNLGRLSVAFRDMLGVIWLINRARSPNHVREVRRDPGDV